MKRILLCTDGSVFSQSSYQYGAWLATRLGAAVDVLYVTDARSQATEEAANLSGSIGVNASDVLLNQLVALEHEKAKLNHQRAKLILQEAEDALTRGGVETVQVMHKTGFLVDYMPELEPEVDLIILGKRGETAEFASGHLGANLERIVRASNKPCLVTSRQFQPIERFLLAYDGSKSCQEMLQFLLTSSVFTGLELHIITVAKSAEDSTASSRIEEAKQQARAGGFEAVSSLMVGNPENAIAQYVQENNINLLLMGAYGHSRIRHLVIGSTTAQILRSSNIPVLVFR
ncbi:universal stress protein [Calothrix sp. UHCC 0171]|uniref:universal stress protein n=1 Tax=Calothrix sp. UHCC 0171 TaxID=3110245 RepID=UPI002B21BC8D|nr:universal stress protein [Calothrix sp. UHCC 0171]MEA5571805.1 universal stress protein [Calothrix sp. UHCC 0171]